MNKLFTVLIVALILSACSTKKSEYTIHGTIEGLNEVEVKLYELEGFKRKLVSTTTSLDGEFRFTGQLIIPSQHYIKVEGANGFMSFFLENSNIEIFIDPKNPDERIVKGSKTEADFQSFVTDNYENHKKRINMVIDSLTKLPQDDGSYERGDLVLSPLYQKQKDFHLEYIRKNPTSPIIPIIIVDYSPRFSLENYKMIYEKFSDALKIDGFAKYIKNGIIEKMEKTGVGKPVTHFSMKDPSGREISTADFKGKFLFVDFWAATCAPCRMDNKHLVNLYEQYKDKGFEILGVSFDDNREDWLEAIKKDGLTWPQISELNSWNNKAKEIYDNSLPGSVFINPEGVIIGKDLKHRELAKRLAELLD